MGLYGPANLGGGVGLHVPGVELRRAADQEQHDAVRYPCRVDRALRFQAEKLSEAESERGERTGVKKIAPPQAVAEFDGFIGIQTEHT